LIVPHAFVKRLRVMLSFYAPKSSRLDGDLKTSQRSGRLRRLIPCRLPCAPKKNVPATHVRAGSKLWLKFFTPTRD
jgi:hypothetical protein